MPRIVSDIIAVYVFRRMNARVQFLLLQRKATVPLPNTWQAFHAHIRAGETTMQTVRSSVEEQCGLRVSDVYSADSINQFYDDSRDAIVLAPIFAVTVSPQAPVRLGPDYRDAAWFDVNEATQRLAFSAQRWAVRHIDEIMSMSEEESSLYRLDATTPHAPSHDGANILSGRDVDAIPEDEQQTDPDSSTVDSDETVLE